MDNSSNYNQQSFSGGMNLLMDDTHLADNQYRTGFNVRNRYDRLDIILSSQEDKYAPSGIKQALVTFGEFEILFSSGKAYYKHYLSSKWTKINGFLMDQVAPRYWTETVPIATTNYLRFAASANVKGEVAVNSVAGAAGGNLPGLLVQDNINQPQFIFLNDVGLPETRVTQSFEEWSIQFTDSSCVSVVEDGDKREYVPIGSSMKYVDDILYIVSQDGNLILRSVSGRPLDFVVNIPNTLPAGPDYIMTGGGDAYTTAYSVGVGNLTTLKGLADGSLFVAGGGACFSVSKNMTQNAPMMFGEYTFIRKFLFNATCLSDRTIIDTLGDTRFIDLTGIRSFNAIQQVQNEGRNAVFSATIQPAFMKKVGQTSTTTVVQDPLYSAAILFDNYELYGVSTIFGPVIAVYDTIGQCWVGFDIDQTGGKRVKLFSKIELSSQVLIAITEDDKVYRLYVGPNADVATVRTVGICSNETNAITGAKSPNPRAEIQLRNTRVILNDITKDCSCSFTPYVNNRMSSSSAQTKHIYYVKPKKETTGFLALSDVDNMLKNLLFATPNCEQGWKIFCLFSWTGGSITQFNVEFNNLTPMNPLNSQ